MFLVRWDSKMAGRVIILLGAPGFRLLQLRKLKGVSRFGAGVCKRVPGIRINMRCLTYSVG